MKNTRRILAAALTLVMVLGCMATFTFTSAAEEEVNLASLYATVTLPHRDYKDVTSAFTDGVIDGTDAGFYTLPGRWIEEDIWDADDNIVGDPTPTPVEESICYAEADLGKSYMITAISAGFLAPGEVYSGEARIYKWVAYGSNDVDAPISEWTKIAEKTTDEAATGVGYKDTLETPAKYQYIRLYGTFNNANRSIHMNELGIWGIDSGAADVLRSEPWVAPANGTNIVLGKENCVVKADKMTGGMWELTDGFCGDMASDNYWTAGSGGASVPMENPVENDCGAWFQVNLDGVCEIDAIRVVTLLNDKAVYHWEIYATDDPEMGIEGWDLVAEKKTDEISNADGYAVFFDEPIYASTLRIYGTKGFDSRFRVTEIEVWDIEESVTPPSSTAIQLEGAKWGTGMENWINSPNKPEGHPAAFEILYGVKYNDVFNYAIAEQAFQYKDYLTWTLNISKNADMSDAISKNIAPATMFDAGAFVCFRFETALADDAWAPEVGVTYYINVSVKGDGIDYVVTGEVGGFVMNEEPITKDYEEPAKPTEPVEFTISPFSVGSLNGFENWPAEGTQTQLLIATSTNVPVDATWVMTITNTVTGETKIITAKCDSDYDTWLRRFEVCTYEGENQFIPEVGVGYTISAEIYNEAGELIMIGTPTADPFICGEEPIVPTPETPDEPTDPDTPDEPGEDPIDPPAQTGDAAVYATIAVAVAALALVVVFKKRTNI